MAPAQDRRVLGVVLASALCVAVLAFRAYQNRDVLYDRFNLPAFDGHVYAAMAEEPRVFTIAPWGYRLLAPWLVHVSPWNAAKGYERINTVALLLAGLAAYGMLHRLGYGAIPSALAAAALLASDPVARIVRYRLLVEPVTLLLETLFLLAIASRAAWPVLALVGVLGTASKEFFLLLLPAAFLARLDVGWKRAAAETAGVIAPSLALTLILRFWWTPYLPSPPGGLPDVADRLRLWAATQTGSLVLLGVVAAIAAIGAVRPARWRFAFLYVALVAFAAPFLNPSDFSAPDLPRLHVYVLPALLPFVLLALDRVVAHVREPVPPAETPDAMAVAAGVAAIAVALSPSLLLDRYRRVDLRADGDAARVLATCRGTLRAADRLAKGEEVMQTAVRQDAEEPGEPQPRLRWYLRDGWEAADGVATMTGPRATIVVPARPPRALLVGLSFGAGTPSDVRVSMNGRPLDRTDFEGVNLRIPADALVRGDNLLTLERDPGGPAPQLRGLLLRPLP